MVKFAIAAAVLVGLLFYVGLWPALGVLGVYIVVSRIEDMIEDGSDYE